MVIQFTIGDVRLTTATLLLVVWIQFACLTYLSVFWVQRLHKSDTTTSNNGISRKNIANCISFSKINQDSDLNNAIDEQTKNKREINVESFFHITNKFYENAEYNNKLIKEFKQFSQFMVHEFSSENLLFVINIIQFKQFLIENNYTDETFWDKYTFNYNLKDFINPTKYMQSLIELHNNEKRRNINSNERSNYDVLIPFLKIIFETFIVAAKAPFEVNISHTLRCTTSDHFKNIIKVNNVDSEDTILSKSTFTDEILPDLIAICNECMLLVQFSWIRYVAKKHAHAQ